MSTIARRLTDDLVRSLEADVVDPDFPEVHLSTDRYLTTERFKAERTLFANRPIVIAHSGELAATGHCLVDESSGRSILVVRARDGVVRGFINACRHRGTRLATRACQRKAFVCPYHGWTYGLDGSLLSIPHAAAFATLREDRRSLVSVPVTERHGFVWLNATSSDQVAEHLGPLDAELGKLGLADMVEFETRTCERDANWKLVIDLFLEGYHIRTLHRNSIYPFFIDSRSVMERCGDHVSAVSARRTLKEASSGDLDRGLRDYVTPSYLLFPNTILIAHPDYISRLSVYPLAPGRVRFTHTLLIDKVPETEAERDHWRRSFDLIEGQVFQGEDLHIAEEMQRGLESGADRDIIAGKLEVALGWFHDSVDRSI